MKWRQVLLLAAGLTSLLLLVVSTQTDPAQQNNAGISLFEQDNFEAALLAFQAAEVQAPDNPEAYYNAASALAETGRLRAARDSLAQALRTAEEPLISDAYFNLGNVLYELAFFDEAVAAYREVLLRDPQDQEARHNYELALLRIEATPTPTPQEQQTEPEEDQTDPETEPTNNPADEEELVPSPTPSSAVEPLDETLQTPVEGEGGTPGPLEASPVPQEQGQENVEDVDQMLDALQANQRTLREHLNNLTTPGPLNTKDW
jgi:Ca-activated chloride channel family protein